MDPSELSSTDIFSSRDSFRMIRPEEYDAFGIDPADIPLGTFPALKHPSQLPSTYGGNAYGFGIFESSDRLNPKDIAFIQSLSFDDPDEIRTHYKSLNELYRKTGILIRFSSKGKPYYLIPVHLVSSSLSHIQPKLNEIEKVVTFHKKKYLKEHYDIGLLAQQDDFIVRELSLRFKEHRFFILDSLKSLTALQQPLDLVILTKDFYAFILDEIGTSLPEKELSRTRLQQYATHMLWKIYNLLAPEGELLVLATRYSPKTNRTSTIVFKNSLEKKNFALFTHLFKTKKRYRVIGPSLQANLFDFQKYLSGASVQPEVISKLLSGRDIQTMTLDEIQLLPYLDKSLEESPLLRDQEKTWSQLLSRFFDKVFLKPLTPQPIIEEWQKRFSCIDYTPHYMLIYLGQKKAYPDSVDKIREDVLNSSIAGCQFPFLAEYKDSFGYVISTLQIVKELKTGYSKTFPQILHDRLIQPLENKRRRFIALNHVMKLVRKISLLQRVEGYLNPDRTEVPRTKILDNLAVFPFFGFSEQEIREIILIVLGHSTMGRIISGKLNERSLKPLSDLARRYDRQQALNLLRYCRLMTLAETVAAKGGPITTKRLIQLFDIYETAFKVVTNRDLDWDVLMDEKTSSAGGTRDQLIQRILMMTNHFEFLYTWQELSEKGAMEKEALADYDRGKLARIEDVIAVVSAVEYFISTFLNSDPLQFPAFCRKFLDMEFHGTSHLFEKIDSRVIFILLWITVNVVRGKVINFNPLLTDIEPAHLEKRVKDLENEARGINIRYLDLLTLEQLSNQLDHHGSTFIVGTGFQLRINTKTGALDVEYVDLTRDINVLDSLLDNLQEKTTSEISTAVLTRLEILFFHLESFSQSHQRLLDQLGADLRLPAKQKKWYEQAVRIREKLLIKFRKALFEPQTFFTDINRFYAHAPALTDFLLPEFTALRGLNVSGRLYLKSSIIDYILATARKMQALVVRDRKEFQDFGFLHRLAQREFGPLATGIIGVSGSQLNQLEQIVERLRGIPPLFDALIRSFLFQDLGRIQSLRQKYEGKYNPADFSHAGAFFLEKEAIARKYDLKKDTEHFLIFLVKYHSLLHHIVRGEIALDTLENIISPNDKDLFDAFFVFSFAMLSALREDLMLEDLAGRLFEIRRMCQKIIAGETTFQQEMDVIYARKGDLYHGLEDFQMKGLPSDIPPSGYIASHGWKQRDKSNRIVSGKMILALERLLRLRGIHYIGFYDLFQCILKVPLKYTYTKRHFSGVGYATYEKELFEALRLYNTLQNLGESVRHSILDLLIKDRVRIYGFEKISGYLNYENQVKLLLIALLATKRMKLHDSPISLNFLPMDDDIQNRYEAVNDFLNRLPIEKIWGSKYQINQFFKAKMGILINREENQRVLSVCFRDPIHFEQKVAHINSINDVEQLKTYFHSSLRSLRKYPFHTEDHELRLERVYEERLKQIAELILAQIKRQMSLIDTFEELHNLVKDLESRSLELNFTDEQRHRLKDMYELRRDVLKRDKLMEIENTVSTIQDTQELKDFWNSTTWYLLHNRVFLGKDFEFIVARKFDEAFERLAHL
jgi:hypothetical protein